MNTKVLHVDDDERVLRLVGKHLEGCGYSVISTTSPFIAPIIKQEQPDLLVMDVDMPLLSGDRIISIIRGNEFSTIPVIYFSGRPLRELSALSAKSQPSAFVAKDAGLQALVLQIRKMINT